MNDWLLTYDHYDPDHERTREALCALGNGYFATRGASAQTPADDIHYPGTYLAGGFNRRQAAVNSHTVENESLVNLPNWLPLHLQPHDGQHLHPDQTHLLHYRLQLDIHHGLLTREMRCEDANGRRTFLRERRFIHMRDPHLACSQTTVIAENWSGDLYVSSALDASVSNAGVARYRDVEGRHFSVQHADADPPDHLLLIVQTTQSQICIAMGARHQFHQADRPLNPDPRIAREDDRVTAHYTIALQQDQPLTIEKTLALYTSRDAAISEPTLEARDALHRVPSFSSLLDSHQLTWEHLWRRFDLELYHDDEHEGERTEMILRLHVFHLLQVASPNIRDLDVGIPARGLHGEAYRGHIFWDELFIFPLLNFRLPEITRALLEYRFRRLPQARLAARDAGYAGAMFPWQSGSNGREESQRMHLNPISGRWIPDRTHLQRHVNAAIAYNVWQYYQVTCDREFMSYAGAEMLLEIARFWASKTVWNNALQRYEIHHVVGPDEFHTAYPDSEQPGLSNNAYTNVMATWVLMRALELPDILPADRWRELCEMLQLHRDELDRWKTISQRMCIPFHDGDIISQFQGYEALEELDWDAYRQHYGDIHRLDRILESEGHDPNRFKASKQADVLMLFYLFEPEELEEVLNRLGYQLTADMLARNIQYYLARTSHGSTLSRVVHSRVLARADRPRSWHLFSQALESDVADIQGGTTAEGIHLGAMAGTVDLIQRAYTGLEVRNDTLWLDPMLPDDLNQLYLNIRYREHALNLCLAHDHATVKSLTPTAEPIRVGYRDHVQTLHGGQQLRVGALTQPPQT